MTQMNLSMKQKQIHWHRQQTCGCQGGSWGWGGWRVSLGFSSVAQSCLTLCDRMLQHARLPCPSPTPRACSNSCPLSLWCHTTISSSVIPFSSCLQSFPASGSFPMSQFFTSGGQSIAVSAVEEFHYSGVIFFRMDWLDLLNVQGSLKSFLQHHSSKASVLWHSVFFIVQLSHPYMITGKTIVLAI